MQPLTTLEALRRRLAVLSAIEESVASFVSCYLDPGHGPPACRLGLESGHEPCARRSPGRGARVFIDFLVARFQPTPYWDLNWAPTNDSATAPRRYTRHKRS